VRFDDADQDVDAFLHLGTRRLQHLVGLADARCGADEDLQPPERTFLLTAGLRQQRFGRRTLLRFEPLVCHRA
jgi:hypothetical protein